MDEKKYAFSIHFLSEEIKRCEEMGISYIVLHPGSSVGIPREIALNNVVYALNKVLENNSSVTILLETMAGKGTELGCNLDEIKYNFVEEPELNEKELLHCKIIRDADKLDNFRVKKEDKFEDMFPNTYNSDTVNYESISSKVYENFMKHKCIRLEDRKTIIDYWICILAFIFDLNFDISLKYVKENNYIDVLIDRIEYKNETTKRKMEDIRKCAKDYLDRK